jgi:hypothetical protein
MSESAKLPPREQARLYREKAEQAERMVAVARNDDLAAHCRELADMWRELADDLEEAHRKARDSKA